MANFTKPTDDKTTKPNIVLTLADNVGWGILSRTEAPHLRRALTSWQARGIRFLNYNVEAQCAPTRASHHDRMLLSPFGHVQRQMPVLGG